MLRICCHWGGLHIFADWESSSIKSLSEAEVKQGDDEHSDAHVKFVDVGDNEGEVCVAAFTPFDSPPITYN